MAAIVLDVGKLVQSPIPKIFGYFLCCRFSLSRSKNPATSTIDDLEFFNTSGADIGGVTWIKSY